MTKHTNNRLGQTYNADNSGIESNCSDISFVNQGINDCTIFCGDSPNGRLLKSNEAVDYNNEIGGIEITVFRVVFTGGETSVLYVERSYKTIKE